MLGVGDIAVSEVDMGQPPRDSLTESLGDKLSNEELQMYSW